MANRITRELVDDIDSTYSADETVTFAIDGIHYEIDLAAVNAEKLRTTLQPWIDAARKTSKTPRKTNNTKAQLSAIREWASANGHKVADRGRISSDIIAAYQQRGTQRTDAQIVAGAIKKLEAKVDGL